MSDTGATGTKKRSKIGRALTNPTFWRGVVALVGFLVFWEARKLVRTISSRSALVVKLSALKDPVYIIYYRDRYTQGLRGPLLNFFVMGKRVHFLTLGVKIELL